MQIFVATPFQNKIVNTSSSCTLNTLVESENLNPSNVFITCGSRTLDITQNLLSNKVSPFATININLRCLGGALTENDRVALTQRLIKTVCRVCYATNSPRASNCRKKKKCGRSSKLRMAKSKKSTKKGG